jgi:hypothetical protein
MDILYLLLPSFFLTSSEWKRKLMHRSSALRESSFYQVRGVFPVRGWGKVGGKKRNRK